MFAESEIIANLRSFATNSERGSLVSNGADYMAAA